MICKVFKLSIVTKQLMPCDINCFFSKLCFFPPITLFDNWAIVPRGIFNWMGTTQRLKQQIAFADFSHVCQEMFKFVLMDMCGIQRRLAFFSNKNITMWHGGGQMPVQFNFAEHDHNMSNIRQNQDILGPRLTAINSRKWNIRLDLIWIGRFENSKNKNIRNKVLHWTYLQNNKCW